MPGTRCAVFGCNNSRVVTKKLSNKRISYHRFPKGIDDTSITIREEWNKFCCRADKFNPITSVICSEHFTDDDYERDLRNELLGCPLKRILKKTAVPTINLPSKTALSSTKRKNRLKKNKENCEVNKKSKPLSQQETYPNESTNITTSDPLSCDCNNNSILKKYKELESKTKEMEATYRRKIKQLNLRIQYYQRKLHEKRICTENSKKRDVSVLRKRRNNNK